MFKNMDEGYIKFKAHWQKSTAFPAVNFQNLNHWRNTMYEHQLIGAYSNGIGYGNISERIPGSHQFYISGSATGNLAQLTEQNYAKVIGIDLPTNSLTCVGPTIASSESMSHAVIYQTCDWVNAVIHIHHLDLWKKLLHIVPTTDSKATYGTPDMAYSIINLLNHSNLSALKIFVMEGHEEGIFAFGEDLATASAIIFEQLSNHGLR